MRTRELKAKSKRLFKEARAIDKQIEARELKHLLPKLKKQYEGKYFKYRNSFSCPQKESDYWYLYSKVSKVISVREVYRISFEMDIHSKIEIHGGKSYMSCLGVEISKEEYYKAAEGIKVNCLAALA